jgi:hypothetical protein
MTKREQILQAIRTALAGTTGVGNRIYRSRVEPMARQESPAIIVEPLRDRCEQNTSLPKLDWSLLVRVAVVTRANVPDQAADPVIESLHSKLMADLSLGGLVIDIQPFQVEFQAVEADVPAGVALCDFVVKYRTSVTDLGA